MRYLGFLVLVVLFFANAEAKIDPWNENLRVSIDGSARTVWNGSNELTRFIFAGLDVHKVVSTQQRDWVTLTLQSYLTRVDNGPQGPHPIFDDADDWALVWRIFNANIKILKDGGLNLCLGHLELPFGLEYPINTNGSLRNYQHQRNFKGIKADWGVSLNGTVNRFEYEVAWTRGTGNRYRDQGSGAFSGRVGTARNGNLVWGLSFLEGDLLTPINTLFACRRLGADVQWYVRQWGLLGEVAVGRDAGSRDVQQFIGEINWRNNRELAFSWLQVIHRNIEQSTSLEAIFGVEYMVFKGASVAMQHAQEIDPNNKGKTTFQIRYRH